jgi:hypothetical protein
MEGLLESGICSSVVAGGSSAGNNLDRRKCARCGRLGNQIMSQKLKKMA